MTYDFGKTADGLKTVRIVIEDGLGNTASFINYGAALQSLVINGTDVVLGYDSIEDYEKNSGCLGAVMGRCTNRISNASFVLDGQKYRLSANVDGKHHIHGGFSGFNKKVWNFEEIEHGVRFSLFSAHGDEGYPGNLNASVEYIFKNGVLSVSYDAVSDAPTLINLTNHSYFNLDGEGEVYKHTLHLEASKVVGFDSNGMPADSVLNVDKTAFDFRDAKPVEWALSDCHPLLIMCKGLDHNYILDGDNGLFRHVATLTASKKPFSMEVWTDMPAMCLYSGNYLKGQKGKKGKTYMPYSGICFETQYVSNAVNLTQFKKPVFKAGEHFTQHTEFRFR